MTSRRAVEVASKVEKENKAFKAAVSGFRIKQYQDALKAHNDRIAEITKEPKGSAGSDGIANVRSILPASSVRAINSPRSMPVPSGIIEANPQGLMSDKEYYESKAAFIRLNAEAQESALQHEIDRLASEKVSGKERIDNLRKIAPTGADRQDPPEAGFVRDGTQEEAAICKVAQAYESARARHKATRRSGCKATARFPAMAWGQSTAGSKASRTGSKTSFCRAVPLYRAEARRPDHAGSPTNIDLASLARLQEAEIHASTRESSLASKRIGLLEPPKRWRTTWKSRAAADGRIFLKRL